MKKLIRLTESDLQQIVKESVNRILNEAFKSPKLAAMARQHGGIQRGGYGYVDDNNVPIADLTDDMIGDEAQQMNFHGIADNAVNFKDGTSVPIIDKTGARALQKQHNDRAELTRRGDTSYDGAKHFQPSTEKGHFARSLRRDLGTANKLKQSNNWRDQTTYREHWKDYENDVRPKIRSAYNGDRDLSYDSFFK